jgi:hypothetical protein
MGIDQAAKLPPRDDGIHFGLKELTPRLLMVSLKTYAGKGHLTHGNLVHRLNQVQRDLPRSED